MCGVMDGSLFSCSEKSVPPLNVIYFPRKIIFHLIFLILTVSRVQTKHKDVQKATDIEMEEEDRQFRANGDGEVRVTRVEHCSDPRS